MLNPFDQIETWRGSLLDTSKRNPMIGLKVGSRGAIELLEPSPAEIWERIVVDGGSIEFPPPPPPEPIELEPSAPIPPRLQGGTGEDSTSADQTASSDDRRSAATFPLVPQPRVPEMGPVASRSSLKRVRVPGQVVTSLGDKGLATRLNRLAENAKISLTEQGVPTLFLAFGALRWFESPASEIDVYSPLVLFPVKLHRDDVASSWTLSLHEDEPSPNYSLGQLLKNDFNLTLPELPSEEGDAVGWRDDYFDAVRATVKNQTRWEVVDRCCLGIFSYQKIAMWKDLGDNKALIAEHRVCGAMAGGAAADFTLSGSAPSAAELDDKISPLTTFQILEADSSQQEAIEAVKAGDSLIVDGPPGTGKSQTIANLIAEFLALGKTVLFVSEKAAALEVVKRRLDQHGLGDFCLELHSHKANKIQIIQELGRSLQLAEVPASNRREALQRL
ncbi:MAG TPA: DUF4011 domain-containing protein, partial [Pirellulales bacterium]